MARAAPGKSSLVTLAAAAALVAGASSARGYEFEVRARSIGQGYQLWLLRPLSGDRSLERRRFTLTMALDIWDIGRAQDRGYSLQERPRRRGPDVYVSAYLTLDHDFGAYVRSQIRLGTRDLDALDLVPELERDSIALDVLWLHAGVRGIAGGVLDLELGRLLRTDALDAWSFDGASVVAHTAWRVDVEAFGGLRVRDASFASSGDLDLDGTGSGECAEYVEGASPGTGSWRPIKRPVMRGERPFEAEFDVCPQRDEAMPVFGAGVRTAAALPVQAALAYRRSVSRTPGIIGPVGRFEFEDLGYYPNEAGQAPAWGLNEEQLTAAARATLALSARARVTPFAASRLSLLHGRFDRHLAGARLRYGDHAIAPTYAYVFPSFDGDSIFNVFYVAPYHDARLDYELSLDDSAWSGHAGAWLRWFGGEQPARAGGGQLGARYRRDARSAARLDLFYDGGYGGLRLGGYGSLRWRAGDEWDLASRLSVVRFEAGQVEALDAVTLGAQLGATYRVDEGIGIHLTVEQNSNRFYTYEARGVVLLDLAFSPEH